MGKGVFQRVLISVILLCGSSEIVWSQNVTLSYQNERFETVLTAIKKQTGYSLVFSDEVMNVDRRVSIDVVAKPLSEVLGQLLQGTNVRFEVRNRKIYFLATAASSGVARDRQLKGRVLDAQGEPVIGAGVIVKGKPEGTVTDLEGYFTLTVAEKDLLRVTYIGCLTQEVVVGKSDDLVVRMKEDNKLLEELVVVGYGTQKRSDITGSVTSIKSSELLSSPSAGAIESLQGRAAGVVVQNSNGDPSGAPVIRIRGANSLTYGNNPLVIIDGVQDGNLANLNPNQIESFQILKDAAALSVYGAKGANGVILVTTKMGAKGRPQVSYNGFVSVDKVRRVLPTLNAQDFATLFETAQQENGLPSLFSPEDIAGLGEGTNWQEAIFRTGLSHNHNLGINGSKDATSYFVALTVNDKKGIMRNSSFQEYSLRANVKSSPVKWLNIQLTTFASYSNSLNGANDQALSAALQWTPTKPIFASDGRYSQPGGGVGPNAMYNPVGYTDEITTHLTNMQFNSSLSAEVRFTDWLKFSSLLAVRGNSETKGYFDNQLAQNGPASDVYGHKTMARFWSVQNTNILSFDKAFDRHHLQVTGVYELLKDRYESVWTGSYGIPVELGYNGVPYGTSMLQPWFDYTNTAMMSFMGRANYAYANRYLLSGSLRYDGASQLATGNKFNLFGAVSAGWNMMEEPFMESLSPTISELKLRASYGSVGNASVPAYASHRKFSPGMDANGNATLAVSQLANKELRWERTNELNVGVDSRFMNGRINVAVEYYDKRTTDLLMWKKVPIVLGGNGSILTNVGAVSNKGIDLTVGGIPIDKQGFKWDMSVTMNYNRNRIMALDGLSDMLVYASDADYPGLVGSFVQMVGQPMGTFLGFEYNGVWQVEEAYEASKYKLKPGDAKYVDQNDDTIIDDKDIVVIGNAQPNVTLGFNNTFSYKGFDLNLFFNGVFGNELYNQNRIRRESYAGTTSPTSPIALDHWTRTNPSNVPAFSGLERINSSRWVEDGSYIRLKNITLGYRFAERALKTLHLQSLRLYVSANNMFTFTRYTGYDPEASMGVDAVAAGVDRGVYPSSRSLLFGLDVTF